MTQNKISIHNACCSLFASRDTLAEVFEWLEKLSGPEQTLAYTAVFMALNTTVEMIKRGEFGDVQYTPTTNGDSHNDQV